MTTNNGRLTDDQVRRMGDIEFIQFAETLVGVVGHNSLSQRWAKINLFSEFVIVQNVSKVIIYSFYFYIQMR